MARKSNLDVRERAKADGVKLWEIADKLRLRPAEFSIELRYELPDERKKEIFGAIETVRKEHEE